MDSSVVTVAQLAALLQVSRCAVYRLVHQGCPCLRLSRRALRFELEAVLAWLRERSERPARREPVERAGARPPRRGPRPRIHHIAEVKR